MRKESGYVNGTMIGAHINTNSRTFQCSLIISCIYFVFLLVYLFMVHLMAILKVHTKWRQTIAVLMNKHLKIMWKEAVVA
jgi:hypothetical protein